jgi:hypothetical protein
MLAFERFRSALFWGCLSVLISMQLAAICLAGVRIMVIFLNGVVFLTILVDSTRQCREAVETIPTLPASGGPFAARAR